jgi:hypothetical protein
MIEVCFDDKNDEMWVYPSEVWTSAVHPTGFDKLPTSPGGEPMPTQKPPRTTLSTTQRRRTRAPAPGSGPPGGPCPGARGEPYQAVWSSGEVVGVAALLNDVEQLAAIDETLQTAWSRWAFDLWGMVDGQADVENGCRQTRRWFMTAAQSL